MEIISAFLAIGVIALLYFVPTVIGWRRTALSNGGIFLVNLFFGWTVFGWLFAFVWACTAETHKERAVEEQRHANLMAAIGHKNQGTA